MFLRSICIDLIDKVQWFRTVNCAYLILELFPFVHYAHKRYQYYLNDVMYSAQEPYISFYSCWVIKHLVSNFYQGQWSHSGTQFLLFMFMCKYIFITVLFIYDRYITIYFKKKWESHSVFNHLEQCHIIIGIVGNEI